MKQKIDWKNHFIGLLVVVIGITIAFMLENWRQEQAASKLEQKYFTSFKDDLQYDSSRLDSTITAVQNKIYLLKSVIGEMSSGDINQARAEEVITDMLSNHSFVPKQATYESVKNSGGMNIISDYEVKEAIVSYYSLNYELRLKEQVFFDYLQEFVLPFVYKNVEFLTGHIVNKSAINSFEFKNIVAGYYGLTEQNFQAYKDYKNANEELLKNISVLVE
ncbi:MAG: DUF6090 family protein [Ignavibacteriaceae bacterium]